MVATMTERNALSAHTPGPWAYDGPPDNIHIVQADHPHMRICFLTSNGPTEANARLIASAPDMLAALQRIIKTYDYEYGEPWPERAAQMYRIAKRALAKAEKPCST
jgi:hypothetical protein